MRTGAQLISMMEHAIGATPDSRHDLWDTLNEAGDTLTGYHEWTWRQEGFYELTFTAGEGEFDLPTDFDGIRGVHSSFENPKTFMVVTAAEILQKQAAVIGPGGVYWMAFSTYTTSGGLIVPRGLIHPLPTDTDDPPARILYRRKWAPLSSATPNVQPSIPQDFERALVLLARAMAVEYETQRESLEMGRAMAELKRLRTNDIERQMEVGKLTGGAGNVYEGGLSARGLAALQEGQPSVSIWPT